MSTPPKQAAPLKAKVDDRPWLQRISRSGYFFAALLGHLIVFLMVATLVIFPAFNPPTDNFTKTFVPPSSPPPPPPSQPQTVEMPTHTVSTPTAVINSPSPTATFSVPLPDLSPQTTPVDVTAKMQQKVVSTKATISTGRLSKILETEKSWGRDRDNIMQSNGDPHNVVAKFPVYLAKYADGDWDCNVKLVGGRITEGSLPNMVQKINEWSHKHITGEVVPDPLDIGGPELMAKRPPFVFFTGHKDFHLTDQEVKNLSDYLQVGGCIWGDNTLAGRGSRFDVAFRREMKKVIPDIDKDFQKVEMNDKIYTKSWYNISALPTGMNYYKEPLEHIDIDGKLAILYTPNDYSDMFSMVILAGDTTVMGPRLPKKWTGPFLTTNQTFWDNSKMFFRNFDLEHTLACQQLGMNIVGYLLVRFDENLLLAPP